MARHAQGQVNYRHIMQGMAGTYEKQEAARACKENPTDVHWSRQFSSKTPLGSVTPVNGMISIRDKAKGRGRTVLFTRTN